MSDDSFESVFEHFMGSVVNGYKEFDFNNANSLMANKLMLKANIR